MLLGHRPALLFPLFGNIVWRCLAGPNKEFVEESWDDHMYLVQNPRPQYLTLLMEISFDSEVVLSRIPFRISRTSGRTISGVDPPRQWSLSIDHYLGPATHKRISEL